MGCNASLFVGQKYKRNALFAQNKCFYLLSICNASIEEEMRQTCPWHLFQLCVPASYPCVCVYLIFVFKEARSCTRSHPRCVGQDAGIDIGLCVVSSITRPFARLAVSNGRSPIVHCTQYCGPMCAFATTLITWNSCDDRMCCIAMIANESDCWRWLFYWCCLCPGSVHMANAQ